MSDSPTHGPNQSDDEARAELLATEEEDLRRSSLLGRALFIIHDNIWVRLPIVLVLAGIIGGIMLKVTEFMPGYLAVLLFFLLGLVG